MWRPALLLRPSMLAYLASALALLGRYGTQGFALSIFLGLALPQFSAAARPLLPVTIFCFTTVVFMRADFGVIAGLVRRPAKLVATCLWLLFIPALLIAGKSAKASAGPRPISPLAPVKMPASRSPHFFCPA